jgi:SAM-dependent methyltransferase
MAGNDREKWNSRYRAGAYAERTQPSALLEGWIDSVPVGRAMDVACGAGRNALYLAERGFVVDAIDISGEALDRARETARRSGLAVNWLEHDLDQPLVLDFAYQLIVIIRYVNLPLIRRLADCLVPGGFLVCEQHLVTGADVIGPRSPDYRVCSGDLRAASESLQIHHLEEGLLVDPDGRPVALARLVAQRL